jgi:hypothetical protein
MPGFLVSLCNVTGRPGLVSFDTEVGFRPLDLAPFAEPAYQRGCTGITRFADGFAVGLQATQAVLLVEPGIRGARVAQLAHAVDTHGLLATGDGLLAVSTGTNQVLEYDRDLRFRGVFGHDDGVLLDRDHMNDLAEHAGRLVVASAGPARPGGLLNGALRDARTGETLFDGLSRPHSVVVHGGELFVLNSNAGVLLRIVPGIGAVQEAAILGFARGLHVDDRHILIGRSAWRRDGRTTLLPHMMRRTATPQAANEFLTGGIFVIDRATGAHAFHQLAGLGSEVYAIHPLP